MSKFIISYKFGEETREIVRESESRESARAELEGKLSESNSLIKVLDVRSYAGYLDEKIRNHIDSIKIDVTGDDYLARVKERLRCCADAAYMFGEASQDSLERSLGRMSGKESNYAITGLDGHMFSFSFRLGGMHGGLIFHCNAKEWASHT